MIAFVALIDLQFAAARGGAEQAKRTLGNLKDCVDNRLCI